MVVLFGYGWVYIFSIQIIAIALIGIINYVSLFKTKVTIIENKELNFHEFLSMLYLNKVTAWKWRYVCSKDLHGRGHALNMYGWLIPRVFIYVGLVLIFFFILLDFIPAYIELYKFFSVPMYLLMFSSLPVCFYMYHKFRYKIYKIQVD